MTVQMSLKRPVYRYPHDYPDHWLDQQYLPDALLGASYYHYGDNKNEQAFKAYWGKHKTKAQLINSINITEGSAPP